MHVELALDTGGHGRPYDTALAFEAFSPTVDESFRESGFSMSTMATRVLLIQRRASMESRPQIMAWNCK